MMEISHLASWEENLLRQFTNSISTKRRQMFGKLSLQWLSIVRLVINSEYHEFCEGIYKFISQICNWLFPKGLEAVKEIISV